MGLFGETYTGYQGFDYEAQLTGFVPAKKSFPIMPIIFLFIVIYYTLKK